MDEPSRGSGPSKLTIRSKSFEARAEGIGGLITLLILEVGPAGRSHWGGGLDKKTETDLNTHS